MSSAYSLQRGLALSQCRSSIGRANLHSCLLTFLLHEDWIFCLVQHKRCWKPPDV